MPTNWSVIGFIVCALILAILIALGTMGYFDDLNTLYTETKSMDTYEKLLIFTPFALVGLGVGALTEFVFRKK